jgi:hypothetical protein
MHHRRNKIFISQSLQGSLLAFLVIIELTMLLVALIYLYFRMGYLIEENLYTIHFSSQTDMVNILLRELGGIVIVMGVINTLAILMAHNFWKQKITKILDHFRTKINQIKSLQFDRIQIIDEPEHELGQIVETWTFNERRRVEGLKSIIEALPNQLAKENVSTKDLSDKLQRIKQYLNYSNNR